MVFCVCAKGFKKLDKRKEVEVLKNLSTVVELSLKAIFLRNLGKTPPYHLKDSAGCLTLLLTHLKFTEPT